MPIPNLELTRIAADVVATLAQSDARGSASVSSLVQEASGASMGAAGAAVARVVTQDPWYASKRVWAIVGSILTAALASPDVQAALGPWAAVVSALATSLLPLWSKLADQRPAR